MQEGRGFQNSINEPAVRTDERDTMGRKSTEVGIGRKDIFDRGKMQVANLPLNES